MLDTIRVADYDRMLAIHLGGTLATCRAAWPIFRAQSYGRIVNTSSASVFGLPGTSAYITAKAGIFGLTRALGHDGRGIGVKVNAVMPSAYSRSRGRRTSSPRAARRSRSDAISSSRCSGRRNT